MSKERKYFPPTWDEGFKKIFCTEGNEAVALQLLNAVIDDKVITHIERLDTYHPINAETWSVFDFYCRTEDDERIIVEMQNASGKVMFMNRALVYSALAILDQAGKEWDYKYRKVYFVGILNYVHFKERKQPFTKVMLQTLDDHTVTNKNYLQIFVELPKLAQLVNESTTDREAFLCALRDIGKLDDRPEMYRRESLDMLYDLSSYHKLDDTQKEKLKEAMSTEEDYREYLQDSVEYASQEGYNKGMERGMKEGLAKGLAKGLEEGRKEGRKEGRAEGIEEGMAEIIHSMIDSGMQISEISEVTKIPEDKIRNM